MGPSLTDRHGPRPPPRRNRGLGDNHKRSSPSKMACMAALRQERVKPSKQEVTESPNPGIRVTQAQCIFLSLCPLGDLASSS